MKVSASNMGLVHLATSTIEEESGYEKAFVYDVIDGHAAFVHGVRQLGGEYEPEPDAGSGSETGCGRSSRSK